ncbi:hypothetical protein O998_04720 [Anaplasma phagocytophilum str. Norway variant1]|uniref:Uncharacterized protein n=1 Tax=Anaplasma phagocytophilum str. Norway variant1 TaxID=1392506 RepID=A0A7H9DZQ0_ANAPH|nr:hypothetical protein O998_04720 [Anaplasma phagocytophilum str. Norway variant1]
MKISSPDIDGKVCNGKHAKHSEDSASTTYGTNTSGGTMTGQCSGLNTTTNGKFSAFAQGVGLIENKNWPTGNYYHSSGVKSNATNSNAKAVADDLTKNLTPEEKTIVAGLLAKTIEGGEVVEMCLSPST